MKVILIKNHITYKFIRDINEGGVYKGYRDRV